VPHIGSLRLLRRGGGATDKSIASAPGEPTLLPLYGSVGGLLCLSLPTYRLTWTVRADAAGAFQSDASLLGRVQVNSGTSTFDVPFVIGIP
jgi:hypothetical protein